MKTTQKIGLIPVILLCAAFVMVPMVAAAGPGQGSQQDTNQGNSPDGQGGFSQGPAQGGSMNQGQGGNQGGMMMPDNGQNTNTGSDQNPGNMTAPNGPPDRNFGNMTAAMTGPGDANTTAYENMTWHGQDRMTAGNMTFCHPPRDGNITATSGNWTASDNTTMCQPGGENLSIPGGNMTAPKPADGNVTPPQAPSDNSSTNGPQNQNGNNAGAGTQPGQQQGISASQTQSQDLKDSDLIAAFLKWLEGQSGSSS